MHNTRITDIYARTIDSLIDPVLLGLKCDRWPTRADFSRVYYALEEKDKNLIVQAIKPECVNVGDLFKLTLITDFHKTTESNKLYDINILRAICYAKMIRLPSDVARREYFNTLMDLRRGPQIAYPDIPRLLKTDREHLQEMAAKVDISSDGKRALHRELIAFGMQVEIDTQAVVEDGVIVKEAIYALASPNTVYRSLQEIAKLDGAYREAGAEEVDSIEGQAARIQRLKSTMQDAANVAAHEHGGTARQITLQEMESEDGQ